ncbi:MAG: glycosyltransferase family 4 protein [Bacteroidaceae bacterium]|nr:glycosyltransferase family 4 protein [Bacteroidaceae bacterium]
MKKVLEIINLADSARNFIGDQFSYIRENGEYEMHLICTPDDKIDEFASQHKINYYPVQLSRQIDVVNDIKAFFKICWYIRKNKIDIVVCHQAKARTLGIFAAWLMGVKHRIIFAHGVLYETMKGMMRWLVLNNDRILSSLADKVVCVSSSVCKRRLEDGIDNPCKQIILGYGSCNGVDALNKFNPERIKSNIIEFLRLKYGISESDFVIGFCGRLVKDKGIIELLAGFELICLRHRTKSIKLLIIGEPEKRDALPQDTLDVLNNNENIIFTGRISYNDIQNYYRLMNVLLLPSYREGFPTVVLEASAMGVPVIVSRSTGCIDSIEEGKTGLYINLNPISIADVTEHFFDNDFSNKLGMRGRQWVLEKYEHTIVRQYMLNLINSLVE